MSVTLRETVRKYIVKIIGLDKPTNLMKSISLFFFLFLFTTVNLQAQQYSCQELFQEITSNYDTKSETPCYGSSMLVKAVYYTYGGQGFVVGYLKSSDYDMSGRPYIFCGISTYTWSRFKAEGMTDSWGESFHKYIMNERCDCF